jgi:multiple sugar transport system permease protein
MATVNNTRKTYEPDRETSATRTRTRRLALYALLTTVAVVFVLPLVWSVASSLKPLDEAYVYPPTIRTSDPHFENYTDAFTTLPMGRFLINSVIISLAGVIGAVLTSSMAGYALARLPIRGKRFWIVCLIGSLAFPSQVLLIPHFLGFEAMGWINTYKPLIVPAWLGGGAFNIFLFMQFFRSTPRDVEEAAIIDGANTRQRYWLIMMPMAKPAVIAAAVLSFVFHWRSFLAPLMYLSDFRTFPVSVGLRMYQTMAGTWINLLMAASVIALVPVIIVFVIGQRAISVGPSPWSHRR